MVCLVNKGYYVGFYIDEFKKNLFLMKIQKQGFQTWKNSKKPQKYTKRPSKIISWVILYKNYLSYLFHEDVVIHWRTLMFSTTKKYWVGTMVFWYTSILPFQNRTSNLFLPLPGLSLQGRNNIPVRCSHTNIGLPPLTCSWKAAIL